MYDFLLVFYSDYAVHRFRDTTSSLAQSGKIYTPFSSFIYKRLPIAYIVSCRKIEITTEIINVDYTTQQHRTLSAMASSTRSTWELDSCTIELKAFARGMDS